MSEDGMIHIKGKKRKYKNKNAPVKLRVDAYNALVDVCNESSESMSEIASKLILASVDRIVYDREDD